MKLQDIKYRRDLHQVIDLSLPCVEVGVAEGLFSRDMLAWGIPKLYMVDVWKHTEISGDGSSADEWHSANFKNAQKLVSSYGDKAVILKGLSTNMVRHVPDNSLGLVYLDACHTYECVKADLKAWFPKLVKGGVMAGHDYLMPKYGVREAVMEFCKEQNYQVHILTEDHKKDAGFCFYAD